MTQCDLFPAFTLIDNWGREIQFSAHSHKYWRKNLDGALWYAEEPMDSEVSQPVYALALLRAHERRAEHRPEYFTGRNVGDGKDRPWDSRP